MYNAGQAAVQIGHVSVTGTEGFQVALPDGVTEVGPGGRVQVAGRFTALPAVGSLVVDRLPYVATGVLRVHRTSPGGAALDRPVTLRVQVVLPPFPEGVGIVPRTVDVGAAGLGGIQEGRFFIVNEFSDDIVLAQVGVKNVNSHRAVVRSSYMPPGLLAAVRNILTSLSAEAAVARPDGTAVADDQGNPFSTGYPAGHEIIVSQRSLGVTVYYQPAAVGEVAADITLTVHPRGFPIRRSKEWCEQRVEESRLARRTLM